MRCLRPHHSCKNEQFVPFRHFSLLQQMRADSVDWLNPGWHLVVTGCLTVRSCETGTWSSFTELLERSTVRLLFALEQDRASSVLLLLLCLRSGDKVRNEGESVDY